MTGKEIVQALRCASTPGGPTGDCEKCPYWKTEQMTAEQKEKLGVDTWTSCDVDKVGMDAADLIERLTAENAALREKVPRWISVEERRPEPGTGKMVFDWFQWERDGKDIPKIHPTQKPVKVLRRLIEIFTDPGELVIDPCCGSGSTLRAAAEAGRSAIGFEIDKRFYLAAKEKMLAGARGNQEAANFDGSQMTIGEITEAAQQGGTPA